MGDGVEATVLVVEDEAPLIEIYARWLEDAYAVRTAQSGEAALDKLDESVDVVLLDRLMPGLSGDEVLERVRDRGLNCRVAMVTAVEPDFDIITMGFDDYLVKPVDRERLLAAVDRLVSRSSFAELERRFYALASKRAALLASKPAEELQGNEVYEKLEADIAAIRAELDETLPEVGDEEFVSMIRDIQADADERGSEADDV